MVQSNIGQEINSEDLLLKLTTRKVMSIDYSSNNQNLGIDTINSNKQNTNKKSRYKQSF